MTSATLRAYLWHVFWAAGQEVGLPPPIAAELATDTTIMENSIIVACVQVGYTTDEINALLHWHLLLGHSICAIHEQPYWLVTDGDTQRSLSAWVKNYRGGLPPEDIPGACSPF